MSRLTRLSAAAALIVLVVSLVVSCTDSPTAPTRPYWGRGPRAYTGVAPGSPVSPNSIQIIDWFNCIGYEGAATYYSCEYVGTDYSGSDYWDLGTQSWYTQSNCTSYHTGYCDQTLRAGPTRSNPSTTELSNSTSPDIASDQPDPPPCPNYRDVEEQAFCAGTAVSGTRLTLVKAAIDRIKQRGSACTMVAIAIETALGATRIHVYSNTDQRFRGFTAAAPPYGHSRHTDWIAISDKWTDTNYDAAHNTSRPGDPYAPRNLDQILAHEGDHLLGQGHLASDISKTPNSQACSGLP